jgi:hypothetical protein
MRRPDGVSLLDPFRLDGRRWLGRLEELERVPVRRDANV